MKTNSLRLFCLSLSLALLGCRGQGGIGDGNDNGNDNVGGELTAEQQLAVDAVVEQIEATALAVAGVVDGFASLDITSGGTYGECPVVTAAIDGGVITATLAFPEGCTNTYYGDVPVSGSIFLNFNVATRNLAITYDNFTVDGQTVTGSFILQLTRGDDDGRILEGEIDLTTTGVGSAVGSATIQFNLISDTINIVSADLTISGTDGDAYFVDVDNLLMRPIANGNFIPESGTVTFGIPNTGPGPETITIVITYKGTTPENGVVDVTVGSAEPVEYELPGV